ncbi:transcriptional activator [Colletotrichum asianum]
MPQFLPDTIKHESFLLTAALVVASRDQSDLTELHQSIWQHMRRLVLDVVLGMSTIRSVGCVEGLLILGEWTPLTLGQNDDGGEGAAWSILGLAVRLAYLLRLEDSSFRADKEADPAMLRRRLAWTFTYLSDRQISIRMGQAFWSRGPALSARFTADDFPSLQPQYTSGEDFASLLQAQVELTTLFGNAHDIIFASKQRTGELMTRGDYTKYIDDASRAIVAWDLVWNGLTCSQHLKSCLKIMEKYLRLYVNAFAFQAVLYRASASGTQEVTKSACFPHSAMASPDARHVYEAVDAAEALLRIAIEDIDAEKYLRYMPARFYLYEIHSSVFLYKAHASGAVSSGKHAQTANLMRRFIGVLEIAATDADHIAAKYAKLLNGLWFHRSDSSADATRKRNSGSNIHSDEFQEVNAVQTYSNEVDDADSNHLPSFDEIGLQPLDWIESVEGLFSMPAAFPWDQPIL